MTSEANLTLWLGFNAFILAMLALDLGVFHRKTHTVGLRESLIWTTVWIVLALTFNLGIHFWYGTQSSVEFFTGYLIEKSLSIDNIFVILMIFSYFRIPAKYQHKVLFWGILGALVMRGFFIFSGVALIQRYHWIVYVFGAFLVITGIRMARPTEKEFSPENNFFLRLFTRMIPTTGELQGSHFFVRYEGRWRATPLFVALLMVEATDLIFAIDSIPAILAISNDPFIVYTSNAFAILGLRSLYFSVAGLMEFFCYLRYGLAAILVFVGVKMLIVDIYKMPTFLALGAIVIILAVSIIASIRLPKNPDSNVP